MGRQRKIDKRVPQRTELFQPVFDVIKELGGSGSNTEIFDGVIRKLQIPDEVAEIPHGDGAGRSELEYQLAWTKTYLSKYGVLTNSARGVWSINPDFSDTEIIDADTVNAVVRGKGRQDSGQKDEDKSDDGDPLNDYAEFPEELKPWRDRLAEVIKTMDPFGFERLSRRLLRECGFENVEVTSKTRDGGIDGTGKLRINGIFSFTVAFQCKRYSGVVGAGDVRDFRGSLSTDVEKGVMITTGIFSKAARDEACSAGKKQIDLMDGEEFINKLVEYEIGVKPVVAYEIDEEFFRKI
ncbi:MAG: restriction endonuclease [bacterium]|nr:restriction endonuclease [bacterium]